VALSGRRDLMVPARDSVLLATDVYRPHGPGPFPVLLERTPYDKSASSRSERSAAVARPRSRTEVAAYFVGHGYAVAYRRYAADALAHRSAQTAAWATERATESVGAIRRLFRYVRSRRRVGGISGRQGDERIQG
jgi:hypothetical protein